MRFFTYFVKKLRSAFCTYKYFYVILPPKTSSLYRGKSCTVSSLGILQDGNVAKVLGCSDAIQIAYPFF